MGFKAPNYTQIPNELLGGPGSNGNIEPGLMADLSDTELRIALTLLRMTIGFHRKQTPISLSEIGVMSGVANRTAIIRALEGLQDRDLVEKVATGRFGVTVWGVIIDYGEEGVERVVTNTHQHGASEAPAKYVSRTDKNKESHKETVQRKLAFRTNGHT